MGDRALDRLWRIPTGTKEYTLRRVGLGVAAPEVRAALMVMNEKVVARSITAGIPDGFSHLLRLRASQINGCAFCVRMHARDAAAAGETADRIAVSAAWRDSAYFSAKERAQLALVEAITLIHDGNLPDMVYREAAEVLTEEEIVAVQLLAIVINAWNRLSIASRPEVAP